MKIMSALIHHKRNDETFTNYSPISTSQKTADEEHFLLDMDSIVHRDKEAAVVTKKLYGNSWKKCYLGEEGLQSEDGNSWSNKAVKTWSKGDTIAWLVSAASHAGQTYSSIPQNLALPGPNLINVSRQEFVTDDPLYSDRLYSMLRTQSPLSSTSNSHSTSYNSVPQYATLNPRSASSKDDKSLAKSNISGCRATSIEPLKKCMIVDGESENSVEISTKRPGRPKIIKPKKNHSTHGKLWEFIRDLLRNRETCPSLICWEDYSQAKFRFVRSDEVAKRWGSRKGNTKMTYEKLSRAMRYYYKSKIFLPVLGRRLVYQFGPNAKGWQTDNPNFRR